MKKIVKFLPLALLFILINFCYSFSITAEDLDSNATSLQPENVKEEQPQEDKEYVAAQSIIFDETLIYLTTLENGINSVEIIPHILPENTTEEISWNLFSTTDVCSLEKNGSNVIITANHPGTAILVATIGRVTADIEIRVNDTVLVSDELLVTASSPDNFSVSVGNVKQNPALPYLDVTCKRVEFITWSGLLKNDVNAKDANYNGNIWFHSFPVNNNGVHDYYINADDINIYCYASTDDNSNGELIQSTTWSWMNYMTAPTGNVGYIAYCQNIGFDKPTVFDGNTAGTTGKGLQMEGLRVSSNIPGVDIETEVHIQDIGWQDTVQDGTYAGTMGQNKQIEAVVMGLTGIYANNYQLRYRVHVENIGWQDWVYTDQIAGTVGRGLQIEAIEIQLLNKY